jgi:hypothetical protein
MKRFWMCALMTILAGSVPALGQAPVMADAALNMTMAQHECLNRAEDAFRSIGFYPARYPVSVFGDNGYVHIVVRCSHAHLGVVFFAGAGGPSPLDMVNRLRDAFSRRW